MAGGKSGLGGLDGNPTLQLSTHPEKLSLDFLGTIKLKISSIIISQCKPCQDLTFLQPLYLFSFKINEFSRGQKHLYGQDPAHLESKNPRII